MNIENFIEKTAKGAGKILMKHFGKLKHIEPKGRRDVVTEADKLSEKFIISQIKKKFPNHAILGEETGMHGKSKNLWVIDPLDGTKNYSIRNPFFNVSIAFLQNGEITNAGVYAPFLDEFYYAEKGKGATLNKKRIHVSDVSDLKNSFVQFCRGVSNKAIRNCSKIYSHLLPKVLALRQQGAAELEMCFVAAGRTPVYYMNDFNTPWDVAAGTLIVREAGGKVTNFKGEEFNLFKHKNIIASNGKIHEKIMKEINKALQRV